MNSTTQRPTTYSSRSTTRLETPPDDFIDGAACAEAGSGAVDGPSSADLERPASKHRRRATRLARALAAITVGIATFTAAWAVACGIIGAQLGSAHPGFHPPQHVDGGAADGHR